PSEFGVLDIATSYGGVLVIAMRFGVPGAVARFYYDHREGGPLRDYITTIGWFVMISSFVVGAAALALGPWMEHRFLRDLPFFPFAVLAVLGAFMSGNSDVQRRLIQAREQSAYSAKLSLAFSAVTIVLSVFFVAVLRWGAMGMQLAYV